VFIPDGYWRIKMIYYEEIEKEDVPLDLLLLADETIEQINKYIDDSVFFAAVDESILIGAAAVRENDAETAEIVNIAVAEGRQNQKIGRGLIGRVISYCKEQGFSRILIKTGNGGLGQIALYQKSGFRMKSIVPDYFTENYDEPIYENGIECRDQLILEYRIYPENVIEQRVREYWNSFTADNPEYEGRSYEVWQFGYGDYQADQLLGLVRQGVKRATSSALEVYGADEKVPEAGDLSVVTFGNGLPGCIIETQEIIIKKYKEITADEAALEGEDDLSLEYWRQAHRRFFTLEYEEAGKVFNDEIPVIFEKFKVLFD